MKTCPHSNFTLALSLVTIVLSLGLPSPARSLAQPGTVDASFNPPPGLGRIEAMAVQLDGNIVAAGSEGVFRLHPDGSLDQAFSAAAPTLPGVFALALQADGKILAGGSHFIVRLHSDGALDDTFALPQQPDGEVLTIAAQADGRVLVGGFFYSINGNYRPAIVRLMPDGTTDFGFNPAMGPLDIVFTLKELANGNLLMNRYTADGQGNAFSALIRLHPDGSVDATFTPPVTDSLIHAVAVQPDGRILLGGGFVSVNGVTRVGVARVAADGKLDTGFKPRVDQNYLVHALAVQLDGRIIIGGAFYSIGGVPRPMLARLNPAGSLDNSFDAQMCCQNEDLVYAIALQNDGRVLISGSLTSVGGAALPSVARLNNDRFDPYLEFNAPRYFVDERAGFATIAVVRKGDATRSVSVQFLAESATARAGQDFVRQNVKVSFATGESVKIVAVPILDDNLNEGHETVRLTLKSPKGGARLGNQPTSVLTILDSDLD